jgi:hypothetical protein
MLLNRKVSKKHGCLLGYMYLYYILLQLTLEGEDTDD